MEGSLLFEKILVDSLADGMVALSPQGKILYANESFLVRTGFRFEEVLGKSCREVVTESICGNDCPFEEVLTSGRPVDMFDVEVQGRSGEPMSACVNFTPMKDESGKVIGVIEVIRDITKLKDLKDNLKLASTLFQRERIKNETILNNIPSGVYTVDSEMRLLSVNRSLERVTGYRSEELIDRKCYEVFRSDFCHSGCPLKRSMRTGETLRGVEVNMRAKDGTVIPIASSTAVLRDENGEQIGGICSFRDLREYDHVTVSREHVREFQGMVSKNNRVHEIFDLIETVADSDANVLIEGESGTGKELVARAIHRLSPRKEKPFVGVNCASLNENLMESELFGHVRGAFTGAIKDRPGRFEMADGGTLFLDEVSEIGPHIQVKLLRVLQEKEYHRVGETQARMADIRVIAATNRRIKDRIAEGKFRDDLFYRLNVVSISLPPLRERKEDIPVLVEHFLARHVSARGERQRSFSPLAMQTLLEYPWPGNIRELENAVERSLICSREHVIEEAALPGEIRKRGRGMRVADTAHALPSDGGEMHRLRNALVRTQGNRQKAAGLLGISRVTLWRKMKELGIEA
jgi:PAS domain S-box-containing protein